MEVLFSSTPFILYCAKKSALPIVIQYNGMPCTISPSPNIVMPSSLMQQTTSFASLDIVPIRSIYLVSTLEQLKFTNQNTKTALTTEIFHATWVVHDSVKLHFIFS